MKTQSQPSRRQFIKQTASASVLAITPAIWSKNISLIGLKPKEKMGIALVGLGYYSGQVLAPALQETENCYLAGVVTGTPEKEKVWAEKYGIKDQNIYNYETYDQIADNDDIDIIYVVLPNSMHAEYVIRAAKAGKHVICEKPMASSVEECEAMIKACEDNNRKLSIGYRMQFEPHTQEIMRLGQEKVFGSVKLVNAGAGYREARADHWKLNQEMGGGAMMDMGVYALQAARYVTGEEPIAVTAQSFTTRPEIFTEVDETTMFQLEFPSGALANLHTSFGMGMNYLNVTAEKGWFKLDPFSAYGGIKGESKNGPIDFPQINQQAAQMDGQAMSVMEDKPMQVPGEEGLRDMRVVEAVYRAIESGDQEKV
ncbi:Gfo/Idh/MocA family protein [Tunicatimonas pelagia]|uniref:Gfo/Idh/MocA family protein n=1 Tax=Tunicatimonas pelagia TaxID=931531 RepID=UPI002666D900|nr:Gfo/Idh/MocA family oxidoreductase [Tunicatimonas pelagia]WKN41772.1 Gfo/Idh/MocA family oxidoreductase [Tunicatimonas pelagia]